MDRGVPTETLSIACPVPVEECVVEPIGGGAEQSAGNRRGDGTAVEARVLGPIVLAGPHGPAGLPGARCRTLLALLALNAGRLIAFSSLIDALYGEDPPRTALRTLHSHMSRVRRALQACGLVDVLHTRGAGYLLSLPRDAVDSHRFEKSVARGRAHLAENAIDCAIEDLQAGLDLWRGAALADGEPAGWAAAEVDRLEEVRIVACEDLWDARLRVDGRVAAIDELERLMVCHPTRERLVGLLMVALCRAGRPAAALARYERFRRRLAEDLGVDPGPWLRELHRAILREELSLRPAGHVQRWPARRPGDPGVPRRRRREAMRPSVVLRAR